MLLRYILNKFFLLLLSMYQNRQVKANSPYFQLTEPDTPGFLCFSFSFPHTPAHEDSQLQDSEQARSLFSDGAAGQKFSYTHTCRNGSDYKVLSRFQFRF